MIIIYSKLFFTATDAGSDWFIQIVRNWPLFVFSITYTQVLMVLFWTICKPVSITNK